MSVIISGWLICGGNAFRSKHGPEVLVLRRNECALGVAVGVVIKTGEKLLKAVGDELEQPDHNRRRRRHLEINLERWITMASHAQKVAHMFIVTKGKCRCCLQEQQ